MRIVIFGANGRTGRLMTRLALEHGHHAVVVTRRPNEFPFADPQLTVAGADVRDPSSLTEVVRGADAVLSSLGVPFSLRRIDTYSVGVANIVTAMRDTGVRRLAVVSSTGAYPNPNRIDPPAALRIVEPVITRTIGKSTYDDQRRMENIIRGCDLDWTIVRPSGLFDLPHSTNYVAGEVDPVGGYHRSDRPGRLPGRTRGGRFLRGQDRRRLHNGRHPDDVADGPSRSLQHLVTAA